MTWTGGVEVPAVAVDDVVRVPRVRRLHDEHGRRAEPARAEDERRVVGVNAPGQAGDVVPARPGRAEADVYEPASGCPTGGAPAAARSPACRTCACPSRARLPGPACRRHRPGRSGAWRGSCRPPPISRRRPGRARSCAPRSRRAAGAVPAWPGAEHEPEDDCDGGDDGYAARAAARCRRDRGERGRRSRRRYGAMVMAPPSAARQPRPNGLLTAAGKRHPQGATTFARWSNSQSSDRSRLAEMESRSRSAARNSGRCWRCCCSRRAGSSRSTVWSRRCGRAIRPRRPWRRSRTSSPS